MLKSILDSCIHTLSQTTPAVPGILATAAAADMLAEGDFESAGLTNLMGQATLNLSTMGSSEAQASLVRTSLLGQALTVSAKGLKTIYNGLVEKGSQKVKKGVVQLIGGATAGALAVMSKTKLLATMMQTATLVHLCAIVSAHGIRDLKKGNYMMGVAKTLSGLAGMAFSGYCGYRELTQPSTEYIYNYGPEEPETFERQIKLATVYNNNGHAEREKISNLVVDNHHQYATKWGLGHDVVTTDLVAGQCTNPSNQEPVNCSPYFGKIEYFRRQCANMAQDGVERWIIYGDDDLVYNRLVNPWTAIDKLRLNTDSEGSTQLTDSSVIMAYEPADWATIFPIPGHTTHDPRVSVNSGFIIARMDPQTCDFMEKSWAHRNTLMDPNHPNFAKCPTIGFCQNHGHTSLGDQTAFAAALQDNPSLIDRDIKILLPRDNSSPYRSDIALNTMSRDGCHQGLNGDRLDPPFDIGTIDRPANQHAIPEEDWTSQPAGFRVMGKYPLPKDANGQCMEDPSVPITNIRLAKIQEVLARMPKDQKFTVAMTYVPDGNSDDSQYNHLTQQNHREFAQRNGAEFRLITEPLLKGSCTDPSTGKKADCVPYWNKVEMINRWLQEPADPSGADEWIVYGDDDGIYGNMDVSLSKVVKDLQGGTDASVLIAKDIGQRYSKANTGFMFFRKDEASRNFMADWIKGRDAVAKYANGDKDCPTLGLCKSQKGSLHEQEAFSDLVENDSYKKTVRIVDIRDPKLTYGVNTLFRHGCFNRYQPSQNWFVNGIHYQTEDDAIDSNAKAKPGDLFMQAAGVPRVGTFCHESSDTPPHPIRKGYVETMLKTMVRRLKFVKRPTFKW